MRAELRALGSVLLVVACEAPATSRDASPIDAAQPSAFAVALGTGSAMFEPLDAEGTLVLERGPQGLQHVYVSVRAPVEEGLHEVEVIIERDARVLSAPTRLRVPFLREADREAEATGLLVVVPDPSGFTEGESARLRVRVEAAGAWGASERDVRLRW